MCSRRRSRSGSRSTCGGSADARRSPVRLDAFGVVDVQQASDGPAEGGLVRARLVHRGTGSLAQVGPRPVAVVDVVEVEAGLRQEVGQGQIAGRSRRSDRSSSTLAGQRLGSPHAGCAARSRRRPGRAACGSRRAGTGTAAGRRARRPGGCHRAGPGSGDRSGTPCGGCRRSRAPCRTPCRRLAQAAAELLQEQRRALGRAQHQHRVDGGDVDALVEQVDREHGAQPPVRQVAQRGLALGARRCRPRSAAEAMPWRLKCVRHEPGVLDADAEPEAAHRRDIGVVGDLLHDQPRPGVGAGVDVAQRVDVVAAPASPRDLAQVECRRGSRSRGTGDRCCWSIASQSRSSAAMRSSNHCRIGRPSLRSGVAVRPSSSTGCEVVEQPLVRRRGGVVELVDDHDVEVIRGPARRGPRRAGSGSRRRRARSRSVVAPPTHFSPKDGVAQRVPEGREALVEDLLAVGDEEQPRPGELARPARRSRAPP